MPLVIPHPRQLPLYAPCGRYTFVRCAFVCFSCVLLCAWPNTNLLCLACGCIPRDAADSVRRDDSYLEVVCTTVVGVSVMPPVVFLFGDCAYFRHCSGADVSFLSPPPVCFGSFLAFHGRRLRTTVRLSPAPVPWCKQCCLVGESPTCSVPAY